MYFRVEGQGSGNPRQLQDRNEYSGKDRFLPDSVEEVT